MDKMDKTQRMHERQEKRKSLRKINRMFEIKQKLKGLIAENNTKIIGSLVPDEIIYNSHRTDEHSYMGTVLFADVSGFTELTEKYNSSGKGGPSRLTMVLNDYIGALVQEIMYYCGDVLKFSGDAILAIWKSSEQILMAEVVQATIDCALSIQKTHGSYETDTGITLQVKIAISAGILIFSIIGGSNFLLVGNTIWDVKTSAYLCDPGDIIISPSVWYYVNSGNYIAEMLKDRTHMRILGVGKEWTPLQHQHMYETFERVGKKESDTPDDLKVGRRSEIGQFISLMDVGQEEDIDTLDLEYYEDFSIRPSLDYACAKNLKDFLRKFIIAPVMRVIDENEPLEHLTEMRSVVIVFINIVLPKMSILTLPKAANIAYSVICNIVAKYDGIVNKLSMFDKDLMFLVIFGLRGFKHELETQMALFCSSEIRKEIMKCMVVRSISVGVTSGKTYCGVVGHPLRREYTVIGRTVNKAARLMVTYPDKVVCDRETFMQSKFKARNFTLAEPKLLKGFVSMEPIYEFQGMDRVFDNELNPISKFPIYGRENEIQMYKRYLNDFMSTTRPSNFTKTLLIVRGSALIGKTRFLKEIICQTRETLQVYRFTLHLSDHYIQYQTIRLALNHLCGISSKDTIEDRTAKMGRILRSSKRLNMLCCLNQMLDVEFTVTPQYEALSEEEDSILKAKLVEDIIKKCIKKPLVLVIDNLEHMDLKSSQLISVLIESNLMFIVAAIGIGSKMSENALALLEQNKCHTVHLTGLPKPYHRCLCCQFLNVTCIPLELDRYVNLYSNGIPGWIECFLITLIHSKGLVKHFANRNFIYRQGFCIVDYDLLQKSGYDVPHYSLINLVNEPNSVKESGDKWNMFCDSYNSSLTHLYIQEMQKTEVIPKAYPICSIAQYFNLDDVDKEDNLDITMIKMYDALTIQEQQLLKSSTALGDIFSRKMIHYVLLNKSKRLLALGIKKLFEIHVLICARGKIHKEFLHIDYTNVNPYTVQAVECVCDGFEIDEVNKDLPKYASCGVMKFREPKFRIMVHNLLTDSQVKQLHTRAVSYLENETKRCQSCGGEYFTCLNAIRYDDGVPIKWYDDNQLFASEFMFYGLSMDTLLNSSHEQISADSYSYGQSTNDDTSATSSSFNHFRLSNSTEIRTFSETSLKNCECSLILMNVYTQMLSHCQELDIHEKRMHTLLEYAQLCIRNNNISVAADLLEQATTLLETDLRRTFEHPVFQMSLTSASINTIRGLMHMKRHDSREADICICKALGSLGIIFPESIRLLKLKTKYQLFVQNKMFKNPKKYFGVIDEDENAVAEQMAFTLTIAFRLYKKMNRHYHAHLAAAWALNNALKSHMSFNIICMAYENMINVNTYFGISTIQLERHALNHCFLKIPRLEAPEMETVIALYGHIFIARFLREAHLSEILPISNILMTLHNQSTASFFIWKFLSAIATMLLMSKKIRYVLALLKEYKYLEDGNNKEMLIYYNICIEVRLDVGYDIVPFERIEDFFYKVNGTLINKYELFHKLGTAIWLWYIRKQCWESMEHIHSLIPYKNNSKICYTFEFINTIRSIEGHIWLLIRDIEQQNYQSILDIQETLDKLFHIALRMSARVKNMKPRYLHLKAWYRKITHDDCKADKWIYKALDRAMSKNNALDRERIEQTLLYWNNDLTETQINEWHTVDSTYIVDGWEEYDDASPTPIYILKLPSRRHQ